MAILNNNPLVGASGNQGGYNINNSLRFRSSASAYLSRTPASNGDRQKWTFSCWVKRGASGVRQGIFTAQTSGSVYWGLEFETGNNLNIYDSNAGGTTALTTTALYRDFGAWYHVVVAVDTTQATASNRCKIYVNGNQVTSFVTADYPTQNSNTQINTGSVAHRIGNWVTSNLPLDGYLADVNLIDGQALTSSSFGETDTTTGVWKPKAYTGSYGTNGFYLKFSDIATTSGSNAGLGKDFSGNSNYWTTNNISVTSGTTYDAMTDSPTLTSSTVANYAVMNPLSSASGTLTNGNLTFSNAGAVKGAMGTFGLESGKWYWENTITTLGANDLGVGILFNNATAGMRDGTVTSTFSVFYQANTNVRKNGTIVANYASYTTGDIIGIAYDADTRSITFYKNNTLQGSITADAPTSPYVVWIIQPNTITATVNANFGQQPFSYTPPTGFNRLNAYNLPDSTIKKGNSYMDATLYTGNGGGTNTQNIVNAAGFKPDLVWAKSRSNAVNHNLFDSVRGVYKGLISNDTAAEINDTASLTAFNSNGFTLGPSTITLAPNYPGYTYVGWQWRGSDNSAVTNTSGTITSTVSANTTAGFSVVTYTGNGTIGATVGHGLGVAPSMIIVKQRNSTESWATYHKSLGATQYLNLNQTMAAATSITRWNNTTPSSTVITFYNDAVSNGSGSTYVAYCFAEIAGFSAFGSYTGNGSADGTFVYLGFRPKFVLWKRTTLESWIMMDTSRSPFNVADKILYPFSTAAEITSNRIDIVSNGFKIRTTDGDTNGSGATYIYMAFAENPTKYALAR